MTNQDKEPNDRHKFSKEYMELENQYLACKLLKDKLKTEKFKWEKCYWNMEKQNTSLKAENERLKGELSKNQFQATRWLQKAKHNAEIEVLEQEITDLKAENAELKEDFKRKCWQVNRLIREKTALRAQIEELVEDLEFIEQEIALPHQFDRNVLNARAAKAMMRARQALNKHREKYGENNES